MNRSSELNGYYTRIGDCTYAGGFAFLAAYQGAVNPSYIFTIDYTGRIDIGDQSTVYTPDTSIYRSSAGNLVINSRLNVSFAATNPTDSTYGITFGGTSANTPDTNLYRSAANTLKTDDKLVVGASVSNYGSALSAQSDGSGTNLWDNATATFADSTNMAANVGGGIIFEGEYTTGSTNLAAFGGIYGAKDNATSLNTTGNTIIWARNGRISFGVASSPTKSSYGEIVNIKAAGMGIGTATITGKLNFVSGTTAADGIYFGTDVLMYRSAANVLTIAGGPTVLVIGSATAGTSSIRIYGSDVFYGTLAVSALTSNSYTWTFPDVTGTVITTGNLSSITSVGTLGSMTTTGNVIFDAGTTTADGLRWGTDVYLYRSASNALTTDADFYSNNVYASPLDVSIQSKHTLMGSGVFSVIGTKVKWSNRLIVIGAGGGPSVSYWSISQVTSGTVTGVNGHANVTADTDGITMSAWDSLYAVLNYNETGTALDATDLRIVSYSTAGFNVPHNWILLCRQDNDNSNYHFGNGLVLKTGMSWDVDKYSSQGPLSLQVGAALHTTAQAQTLSWGGHPGVAPWTFTSPGKLYIPKDGIIRYALVNIYHTTATWVRSGSYTWSMYIRKNNTTNTLIQTLTAPTISYFTQWINTNLNVAVTQGDYFEIYETSPTVFTTTPGSCYRNGVFVIE